MIKSLSAVSSLEILAGYGLITAPEWNFLTMYLFSLRIGDEGHDLSGSVEKTNKQWSMESSYDKETIRRAKETLQAKGIISIDGQTWDEMYDFQNGVRIKTFSIQTVRFTDQFIKWLLEMDQIRQKYNKRYGEAYGWQNRQKKLDIALAKLLALAKKLFQLCMSFLPVLKIRRRKQREWHEKSLLKKADAIRAAKSESESEPVVTPSAVQPEPAAIQPDVQLEPADLQPEPEPAPAQPKSNVLQTVLGLSMSFANRNRKEKLRSWNKSAMDMAKQLLANKTLQEVADIFVDQHYVCNREDFYEKLKQPL